MRRILPFLVALAAGSAWAQPAARTSVTVKVTDPSGTPLPDVQVAATGPTDREGTTGTDGSVRFTTLKPGVYRLRFEADGFMTLEREQAIRVGQRAAIDVMLNPAPKPAPPPAPAPPPPPPPPPAVKPVESGTVEMVSLPDWVEKNFISRREPAKESTVGKTAGAMASVLQVQQPLTDQVHGDFDRIYYVIARQATMRVAGREQAVEGGWLVVIPRGTSYSILPRGRNPVVLLSITAPRG
jgi:mannose-6-phosphate isomerase-like protein (cupin superfamily)